MGNILAISTVLLVLLCVGIMLWYFYKAKKADTDIEMFYKMVDNVRDHIHASNSVALLREAMDDIGFIQESFHGKISHIILEKELNLLRNLISKRMKKVR